MCRIKTSLKYDGLSSITSSSNCIPKYISKYKIVKQFPFKKIYEKKTTKNIILAIL